ncbi:hypothetical protein Pelo_16323 [Pelomyxa schiedti]|nr:hypothetical protein Pelo_16323 [Pelomyxa schiedti]
MDGVDLLAHATSRPVKYGAPGVQTGPPSFFSAAGHGDVETLEKMIREGRGCVDAVASYRTMAVHCFAFRMCDGENKMCGTSFAQRGFSECSDCMQNLFFLLLILFFFLNVNPIIPWHSFTELTFLLDSISWKYNLANNRRLYVQMSTSSPFFLS